MSYVLERRIAKLRGHSPNSSMSFEGNDRLEMMSGTYDAPQESQARPNRKQHKLDRMLKDQHFLAEFRTFCVKSWCIESLNFVLEVPRYEACRTDEERRQEALVLWQTFLARHAPQELIVSPPERENVLRRIDAGDFGKDLFDEIKDVLLTRLYEDTFWRFNAQRSFNLSSPF